MTLSLRRKIKQAEKRTSDWSQGKAIKFEEPKEFEFYTCGICEARILINEPNFKWGIKLCAKCYDKYGRNNEIFFMKYRDYRAT